MAGKDWDPDEAIESLQMESSVSTDESPDKTATRLLNENVPYAVLAIIHLAQHSTNERIRLEAARYVTDRVLGRVQDTRPGGQKDPFETITGWLTEQEAKSKA
jgi:hypothetical protein